MKSNRLSFVLCCLIVLSSASVLQDEVSRLHEISSDDAAKLHAQRVIKKFSRNRSAMNMNEFELMLLKLETETNGSNMTTCLNGLKYWNEIEKPSENSTNPEIDDEHLLSICPILLHHIVTKETFKDDKICVTCNSDSRTSVWIYSTLAIVAISLCGLMGVIVIPIVDKNYYFNVLQFFMALAVGTLTGDALLHLLPHAMRPTDEFMTPPELLRMMTQRGIAALLGIFFFAFFERILGVITKRRSDKSNTKDSSEVQHKKHGHSHGSMPQSKSMSSIVWMVILGDGLHNFTDGMTIGAAFSNNIAGGFSTTVAVFCHELPHEMGDFAILLKAGMPPRQAILYNILSSVLSFFGMCTGIFVGQGSQWVFAVAAGLFLYIALVDMVPELKSTRSDETAYSGSQFILQFFGMLTGFLTMLLIALYEDDLEKIFSS